MKIVPRFISSTSSQRTAQQQAASTKWTSRLVHKPQHATINHTTTTTTNTSSTSSGSSGVRNSHSVAGGSTSSKGSFTKYALLTGMAAATAGIISRDTHAAATDGTAAAAAGALPPPGALPPLPPLSNLPPQQGAAPQAGSAPQPLPILSPLPPSSSSSLPPPPPPSSSSPAPAASSSPSPFGGAPFTPSSPSTASAALSQSMSSLNEDKQQKAPKKEKVKLPQPGRIEDIDADSNGVFPHPGSMGARLILVKHLFPTGLGIQEQSMSYQTLLAQGVSPVNKQLTIQTTMQAGDFTYDPNGGCHFDIITKFPKHEFSAQWHPMGIEGSWQWRVNPRKLTFKTTAGVSTDPSRNSLQTDVEYKGRDFTIEAGQVNLGENLKLGALKSITPTITIGASGIYERGAVQVHPHFRYRNLGDVDPAMGPRHADTVSVTPFISSSGVQGFSTSYTRQIDHNSQLATRIGHSFESGEGKAGIAYRLSGLHGTWAASVDSSAAISTQYQTYMGEIASLDLNGTINHGNQQMPAAFGIGLTVVA